jgi:hypothetical protein
MQSSGRLCHVVFVRTDVSEELRASIIRVTRIGELGTTLAVTSNNNAAFFIVTSVEKHQVLHSINGLDSIAET